MNDGLVEGGVTGAEVDDNKTKLGNVSSREAGGSMVVLRPLKLQNLSPMFVATKFML